MNESSIKRANGKKFRRKRFLCLVISIAMILALILVLLRMFSREEPAETEEGTEFPSPAADVTNDINHDELEVWGQTYVPVTPFRLGETEDKGQEYIDSIIFLGDSTTYGMKAYEVLSQGFNTKQVWTPASGTLTLSNLSFEKIVYPDTGEQIKILTAVERSKPKLMVITLGVNGISFMGEESFKVEYSSLVTGIQEISPDTKIILQSIFPVASNYEKMQSINNEKIKAANVWVEEIAGTTGVRYLDTYSCLVGDDGYLIADYQNGDGMHLDRDGFNEVLQYIRTHGYA